MISIFLLLVLIKSIELIYLFQIKEYRWDRFYSFIRENGWFRTLYLTRLHLPAKSLRNVLIGITILVLLIPTQIALGLLPDLSLLLVIPFIPFISLVLTTLSVLLTAIPVQFHREKIIHKAKNFVKNSNVICIGVTGSYGKTSVKEFLYTILSQKYKVAKTDKNMNTDIGIALSILKNLKTDVKYFITEFGAYKLGEIEKETEIIKPNYSILTGLGNQHLDLYGSKENLIKAESYIVKILNSNDTAYINLDFSDSKKINEIFRAKKIYYSINEPADIFASDIKYENQLLRAIVHYKKQSFTISTRLLGEHNILNLLPCIALASDLGMNIQEIQEAIMTIVPIPGKLSIHPGINSSTVLNDSYNSNVNGFIEGIKIMAKMPQPKKNIVTRGIIELGVEKRSSYERILEELYKTNIQLISTDKFFGEVDKENRVKILNDVLDIKNLLVQNTDTNSLILIEGRFPKKFVDDIIVG